MAESRGKWRFWVDRGGTFTDIVSIDPQGGLKTTKWLSVSPHYQDAIVEGIRRIMGEKYDPQRIAEIRIGTTVATNAFLERKGEKTALVTTLGFRDLLEIRQQNRPRLFDLDIRKIAPLYELVSETLERVSADGRIEIPLDEAVARFELQRLKDLGINSVAIAFLHAPANPSHELKMEALAREIGFDSVVLGHRISPQRKYISRAETAVIDAYLTPVLSKYTRKLQAELRTENLLFMQSHGGLCRAEQFQGHNSLLSGPAGGLIGAIQTCREAGFEKILTFDMGGTSTDVAVYDGKFRLDHEPVFHGLPLQTPMLDIHTVAAGGGSVLSFHELRLKAGPESAGAFPGPTCYRNGGPLTVTDANLFLGRIDAGNFPNIFGPRRDRPLDLEGVEKKFRALAEESGQDPKELAQGFLDVAIETMAGAIRKVSVEKGHDPKDFTLCCFGGAGPQVACLVADRLNIRTIFIHPYSSVLSAYGMGLAEEKARVTVGWMNSSDAVSDEILQPLFDEAAGRAKDKLGHPGEFGAKRFYQLGLTASDFNLEIEAANWREARERFADEHRKIFGVAAEDRLALKGVTVELRIEREGSFSPSVKRDGGKYTGFQVISANHTSLVVDQGWEASQNEQGAWILQKVYEAGRNVSSENAELEIFYQRFQAIAEEMGHVLKNTGYSVNIKERLDFSCAIFTPRCELIANAPHIPVHLGSMSECVRAVDEKFKGRIEDGDSFVTNSPHEGGTHLPDITVISPVFAEGRIAYYIASRGHHADIGGKSPGSMPGDSRNLREEGVLIPAQKLVSRGNFEAEKIKTLFTAGDLPARNWNQNLHDLKAQLAANRKGRDSLGRMIDRHGLAKTHELAERLLSYSQTRIAEVLRDFEEGRTQVDLEGGRKIVLSLTKENDGTLTADFTGTSPADRGNFNAPRAVVKAAVLYALRCLIKEDIPLNDGFSRKLKLVLPENSLLNPGPENAVVAGNVETSQALCDALFSALGALAHSQGTMNNLSFGNKNYQYYETLGGGSGAGAGFGGASCVQVHMTNSRLTDPEVFELRFPVRIDLFSRRHGSGGQGRWNGGDGLYRRLTFRQGMDLNLLSQRREIAPQGLNGGNRALAGIHRLEAANQVRYLSPCFQVHVGPNDTFSVETPGGGGFGKKEDGTVKNPVFCYGSNLDPLQLEIRCPNSAVLGRAVLPDHELAFTRFSEDRGCGVADARPKKGETVWGFVYRLDEIDLARLDEYEGHPQAYRRSMKTVILDSGELLRAWVYEVVDKKDHFHPSPSYLWQIYKGAYLINAPKTYLKKIAACGLATM